MLRRKILRATEFIGLFHQVFLICKAGIAQATVASGGAADFRSQPRLSRKVAGFMSSLISAPISAALHRLVPVGALLLAMVSITAGASFAKSLFPLVGPVGTTALRLGIAAVLLGVLLRVWRTPLTRRSLRTGLLYGIAMGGMNLMLYMAIARIPLGIALAIEFLGPLTVAMLASRRRSHFLWIGLALIGLYLLLPLQSASLALDPVGVALALGAGVCWGAYIVTGQRAGADHGARAPAVGMLCAAVVALPLGLGEAGLALFDPRILWVAVGVAILSSAIPFTLEMFALRRLPARSFSVLTSCEPAVGAVMGFFLLAEALPLVTCLGIGLVVAASLGMTLGDRTPAVVDTAA